MKKQSLLLILFISLLVSCQNAVFLPNPNINPNDNNNDMSDMLWHAPENLRATQGRKQYIKLAWDPVANVKRYNIYRAKNAFDVFEQIGETKGQNCEFEIKSVDAGYDVYYRVTAVDPAGNESEMSNIERATTLAQPIINDIYAYEDNGVGKVNVSWFMNNLDAYSNKPIHYDVVCYDNTKKEVARVKSENGNDTTICFEGLNPNTPYLFKVEVYNGENECEESNIVDAVTARRLRPDPVENLTVSQGNSLNQITISFELPGFVDIAVGKNQYEQNPLYFKIYRRVYKDGENKEPFKPVEEKFGVNVENGQIDYSKVKFGDKAEEYKPGNVVSFVDNDPNLKRGEKYEYKVQSFAYCERVITSDKSATVSKGWLVPTFTFETQKLNYTFEGEGKGKKKTNATLKFDFKMDTFGIPYKFKITEIKRGISSEAKSEEKILKEFTSVQEIDDKYTRNFVDLENDAGYYKYKITVFNDKDGELDSYEAIGETLVTNSMKVPEIGDITVTFGYDNKIALKWKWNIGNKYTLQYWDKDGIFNEISNAELLKNYKEGNNFLEYEDFSARPGVSRKYILVVDSGLETSSSPMEVTVPLKPELISNYSYDKISVGINNPSDKGDYTVTATFEDTDLSTVYNIKPLENTDTNLHFDFDIVKNAASKNATAIDATVAGAKVKVVVTENKPLTIRTYHNGTVGAAGTPDTVAGSNNKSEYTETTDDKNKQELTSEITTATVGQALMSVSASKGTYSDYIEIKWNKVLGADNYVIFRDRYHIGKGGKSDLELQEGFDKYVVTLSKDGTVSVKSADDEDLGKYVSINYDKSNEKFTLIDSYRPYDIENDLVSSWKEGQSEITWGAPNKYTVLPVVSVEDAHNCEKNEKNIVTINKVVNIENSKNALGGTKGFGWNVQSSKGTYFENSSGLKVNNGINVTWTEPYFGNTSGYFVFRKDVTGKGNWKKLTTSVNVNNYVDKNVTQGNIYDYAVVDANYAEQNPDLLFIRDQRKDNVNAAEGFMLPKPTISSVTDKKDGTEEIMFSGVYMNGVLNNMIDGYVVQVRNNNIDSNWHDIKDVPITEANKGDSLFTEIVNNEKGLLKVLRDYKHYFRICAYMNVNGEKVYSQGVNDITDGLNTDYIKWGSRQITIDEFARAAIIGMSTGMEKERPANIKSGYDGKNITGLKSTSESVTWLIDYRIRFVYNKYDALHKSKGLQNTDVSSVIINGTLLARGASLEFHQTHYWTESPIKVTYNGQPGSIEFKGDGARKGDSVTRTKGIIKVTWNNEEKEYDLSKSDQRDLLKTLPFIFYEDSYLNNNPEWQ